eukprot:4240318-Amphidinium_carterae.1
MSSRTALSWSACATGSCWNSMLKSPMIRFSSPGAVSTSAAKSARKLSVLDAAMLQLAVGAYSP